MQDDDPLDENVMNAASVAVPKLTSSIMNLKFQEKSILQESHNAGGPSSTVEAILNLMEYCNIGIRDMSRRINISRKKLKDMLEGTKDMTAEVVSLMYDEFKKCKPELFE